MATFKGILYLLLTLPVTLLILVVALLLALMKLILPIEPLQNFLTSLLLVVAECWALICRFFYQQIHGLDWEVQGIQGLSREHWYLLVSNHQSWSDIPILVFLLGGKIPVFRFFVKQQMLWVPIVGLACWAMEFPFMRRYSREQLEANPALRSKDQESTQRFCERMKKHPATIVNYLEGTRFTPAKHAQQASPYQYLLKPKAGGIAYVVTHLGEHINGLIDVTIIYPGAKGFWPFLCGQLGAVKVRMQLRDIPPHFKNGDYQNSEAFRLEFQQWVSDFWQQKDEIIARELTRSDSPNPS